LFLAPPLVLTPLQSAAEPADPRVETDFAPAQPHVGAIGGFFTRIPLRVRLTLWVMLLLGITQIVLGGIFLLYQQSAVDELFFQRVRSRYSDVLARTTPLLPTLDGPQLAELFRENFQLERLVEGFTVTIYDSSGRMLASTPGVIDASLATLAATASPEKPFLARYSHRLLGMADGSSQRQGRLIGSSVGGPDGRSYTVLGAMSDDHSQQLTDTFERTFLLSIAMGLVASAFAGWLIAGFATRPIEQLQAMARRLGPLSMNTSLSSEALPPEAAALRAELDAARSRIATAFAAQERFISNVSHELKTPIAVLLTEGQILDRRKLSPEATRFVESACEEMRRLGSMVESFLTLSRVNNGRAVRPTAICPVNELVMESASHCAAMANQHRVALQPLLTDAVDAKVIGDLTLLRTMIDNLIRNAIRFSPAGEQIKIVVSVVDQPDQPLNERGDARPALKIPSASVSLPAMSPFVQISVRDFGPGIPSTLLPRIFDRFVQAAEEDRLGRGHGLGLEIAQGVAELHGGAISVRNVEPKGCEFTITLPIFSNADSSGRESLN